MAGLNFDASRVAPSEAMDAIPAGWYNAMIDDSELKPTKDGQGAYLQVRFTVIDGQYVNRKVFKRLNIRNNNPQAQEIAFRELSAICHAVGRLQVNDSQELHGLPMKIKVKVRPASGDYEASNDISGYKNINDPSVTVGPTAAPAAPAAPWGAANVTSAPAWQAPAQQPWSQAPAQPQAQQAPVMQAPVQTQAAPGGFPSFNIPQNTPVQQAPATAPAAPAAPAVETMPPASAQAAPAGQPEWANSVPQQPAQTAAAPQQPAPAANTQPAAQHPAQGATPPWLRNAPANAGGTPPWNS